MFEKIYFNLSFAGVGSFLLYFVAAIGLLIVFVRVYTWITPYKEFILISNGNIAASYSLSGALIGFSIPLASAISHSVSLLDMISWGFVAFVIQVITFLAVKIIFPTIVKDIPENHISKGIFLGVLSLVIGIINAACMTY
ncbi:MAG: DUF350 domain-containing protein [Nitrospiraceae bacterium]|nr:DUF350 domain-containing protein [Nitrospiraceae bacterium]